MRRGSVRDDHLRRKPGRLQGSDECCFLCGSSFDVSHKSVQLVSETDIVFDYLENAGPNLGHRIAYPIVNTIGAISTAAFVAHKDVSGLMTTDRDTFLQQAIGVLKDVLQRDS